MPAARQRWGLIGIWLLLGGLAAAILVLEGVDLLAPSPGGPEPEARLFAFDEPDLGGIQVVYERQIASLMRGADGLWYQHDDSHSHGGVGAAPPAGADDEEHVPDPAQSAAIAERLARAIAMTAEQAPGGAENADATGLAQSETMIAFYGRGEDGVDFSEPITILNIGLLRAQGQRYYARLSGDADVWLARQEDVFALLDLTFGPGKVPPPATQ